MLTPTPWAPGAPVRPGDYIASTERNDDMRRHFDGIAWSAPWPDDADEVTIAQARAIPDGSQGGIEWRGLTEHSAAWLAAELEREPAVA